MTRPINIDPSRKPILGFEFFVNSDTTLQFRVLTNETMLHRVWQRSNLIMDLTSREFIKNRYENDPVKFDGAINWPMVRPEFLVELDAYLRSSLLLPDMNAYLIAPAKTTLVIVNGYPRSGKDTFVDHCIDILQDNDFFTYRHSSIETCYELGRMMGWTGEKTPEIRNMLSEMKDLYTKYFNGPFKEIVNVVDQAKYNHFRKTNAAVFVMVREPDEIKKLVDWCNGNNVRCVTVGITGRGETNHESHSDKNVYRYKYDAMIHNGGDLAALNNMAHNFVVSELGIDLLYMSL